MTYFTLSKIEQYAPNNTKFLKKSIELFANEIEIFLESITNFRVNKDLTQLKAKIHKTKASSELFMIPENILQSLNLIYQMESNEVESNDLAADLEQIRSFYKLLLLELEKTQKKLV